MKRSGRNKNCETCGTEFYVPPSKVSKRWCSWACVPKERHSAGPQHQRQATPSTCAHCGGEFYARPSELGKGRKFCSRECFVASGVSQTTQSREKRRQANRNRGGDKNPNFKHGNRVGAHERERYVRFQSGQPRCQHPDCPDKGDRLAQHHVVYEQHVRNEGGDCHDGRNALCLCDSCHMSHHRRGTRVVPLEVLRDCNFEFAGELLGPAAYDYLRRRYVGEDPRLDALLDLPALPRHLTGLRAA
jgi:hypothetical protein